jgi:hypothetical protein
MFYPKALPHAKELHFASEPADAHRVDRKPLRRARRVYFDNGRKVHTTFDAQPLAELVSERSRRKAA